MKLSNHLVLIASFFTSARALVGGTWSMTNVPESTGLNDITFRITIIEADYIYGYYFGQRFSFQAADSGGSIGIQPRRRGSAGEPLLRGVFSTFIQATKTDDPNCHVNGDGRGVSCAFDWVGEFGYQYNLEVKTPGNNLWIATAINVVTSTRIHIGSFTLPDGFFGIADSQSGFIEWLPWDDVKPPNHCAHLPYQETIFGNPTTTREGSVGVQNSWYESGDCKGQIAFYARKIASGVITHCGFRGETGN